MSIPRDIRTRIRDRIWDTAEALEWSCLPDADRARYYETWTKDPEIGGQLAHFMDPRKVRVYIKDSLLKPYLRVRLSDTAGAALRCLSINPDETIARTYVKPHGRRLLDGRIVCWGNSRDWKLILMAVFERAFGHGLPFGVVLIESGNTSDAITRRLVQEAARRLEIVRVEWLE